MSKNITVYYGTMSGNSEELAEKAQTVLAEKGHTVEVVNLEDAKPESLLETPYCLFIVSTWGEGEPPVDAEDFYEALTSYEESYGAIQYGIMGLGDTDYELFNEFARMLDKEMERLGAKKITDRVEADVDYEGDFDSWINTVSDIWSEPVEASAAS